MNNWSSQRSLSQSKVVQSSGIWFVVVPIFAKFLEGINGTFTITIGQNTYETSLELPFSWQLLFFGAMFFMFASIIFHAKCSSIIKKYNTYSEFEEEGNSRLQINSHFKEIIWDKKNKGVYEKYKEQASAYLDHYSKVPSNSVNGYDYLCALDDLEKSDGKDSNAFYFVYNIADTDNGAWVQAAACFYYAGFACLGLIALLNIGFVLKSIG